VIVGSSANIVTGLSCVALVFGVWPQLFFGTYCIRHIEVNGTEEGCGLWFLGFSLSYSSVRIAFAILR
jgi:hypothetical protein